ncbi:uncharacterized protein DUF4276 [Mucilaginibacter oryzae]|uniref:Uncharacterized protein DUF4276 n=1 Tax=Mucilaginibacter oryzae TaxID=468058 RepID=A0A316H513_9SPHI|nr:DUF4276 family protein [Mucilaginibacter oryzae]PWK74143.1 uncharacterized protein DUF4276 [Mucilaginibacter oryzae]
MESIYIAGEDDVTKACLRKIISHYAPDSKIITELPARGGQLKSLIENFNKLSLAYPVILLMDLDAANCAPLLKAECFKGIKQSNSFIFNIACDEAEAWLMSDRSTFAKYFKVPLDSIPAVGNIGSKMKPYKELAFKYKSSLFLTRDLILKSTDSNYIKMMHPKVGASKGPEYNMAIIPFIDSHWDIEEARLNSDSLNKTILRIEKYIQNQRSIVKKSK